MPVNVPWTTVCVFVAILLSVTVLVATGHTNNATVTVLVGLLPPLLVGAGYAERTNKDVRNGVVQEKVRQGARIALDETGVTAVASTAAESTRLSMQALSRLLEQNTAATNQNTAAQSHSEGATP